MWNYLSCDEKNWSIYRRSLHNFCRIFLFSFFNEFGHSYSRNFFSCNRNNLSISNTKKVFIFFLLKNTLTRSAWSTIEIMREPNYLKISYAWTDFGSYNTLVFISLLQFALRFTIWINGKKRSRSKTCSYILLRWIA